MHDDVNTQFVGKAKLRGDDVSSSSAPGANDPRCFKTSGMVAVVIGALNEAWDGVVGPWRR